MIKINDRYEVRQDERGNWGVQDTVTLEWVIYPGWKRPEAAERMFLEKPRWSRD